MPRPTTGDTAMTDAERQACPCEGGGALPRGARGGPARHPHAPSNRSSPAFAGAGSGLLQRWNDARAEFTDLQARYAAWLESLPESLQDSTTAEALRAIADLDLSELLAIEPPRGFGRD